MSLNSVNTNRQAIFALQSLNKTNADLGFVQKRVSTGLRVADARDDGGAFAVASAVRSDIAGVTAVNEQLGGIKGVLQTTFAALTQVTDAMQQARATLTRLADGAISTEQRAQYELQYNSLADQIADFIADANYNGITLLGGGPASQAFVTKLGTPLPLRRKLPPVFRSPPLPPPTLRPPLLT